MRDVSTVVRDVTGGTWHPWRWAGVVSVRVEVARSCQLQTFQRDFSESRWVEIEIFVGNGAIG